MNDVLGTVTCSVVSPPNTLLRLTDSQKTTQASALLMHTHTCDIEKAHFAEALPEPYVTSTVRNLLKTVLKE